MHTQLLDHLAVLGDAIGRIHTRVTSDEPLSDTILEHPVMRRFIDSYPEGIPLPFDKAKRERMIAAFPTWDDARLADFLERGRLLLADPDTPNRERFGARTYLPHLERAIAEKQREPDREGPDRER